MSLALLRPGTCFVEPVANSGMTESGIYVFDHDDHKDMTGQRATMMYRVLQTHKCAEIEAGKIYVVENPYNYTPVDYEGERRLVMAESNFLSELEGYEAAAYEREPTFSDTPDRYAICGK